MDVTVLRLAKPDPLSRLVALQLIAIQEFPGARDVQDVRVLADVLRQRWERRSQLHDSYGGVVQGFVARRPKQRNVLYGAILIKRHIQKETPG